MEEIKSLKIYINTRLVGSMALTKERTIAFEYNPDFLSDGYSISPFFIPLQPGLFLAQQNKFYGNFGAFDDSLPDSWGSLILDRFLLEKGIDPTQLSTLQRLALVGSSGRGALEYYPDLSTKINHLILMFLPVNQRRYWKMIITQAKHWMRFTIKADLPVRQSQRSLSKLMDASGW